MLSQGRIPVRRGNLNRRARVATVKGVLGEENSVLGDHVKVLGQGTVRHETDRFLHAFHMPRPTEVTRQRARVRTSRQLQGSTRGFGASQSNGGCCGQVEAQIG